MENRQLPLLDDLRRNIAQHQVVLIVGAGVSIATTNHADVASWPGLLRSGVAQVEAVVQGLPNRWADRQREAITSGDLDDLLGVAEQIARKLGAPRGGEFRRWLRETVGQLQLADRTVIDALLALGTPLCTTNYDALLESASGLEAVTWKDPARCERVLRGDEKAIVHLHGHYRDPESVVLGLRSYEDVLGNEPAQALLRALRTYRTLLFVGYGGGLADPNFAAFLSWCERVFPESEYRSYRLARNQEVDSLQAQHGAGQRLFVLGYGPEHTDLAEFLRALLPESEPGSSSSSSTLLPSPREQALTNAVAAYRSHIARSPRIQRVRFADVASRAEDRDRPAAFDRVPLFVQPTLERRLRHPERTPAPELRHPPGSALPESNERTLLQVLTQPERLCLLIGGPGTGKSELGLWLLAKQCTPGQALPELPSDCVPVRIELRQFDHDAQRSGPSCDFFSHLEHSLSAVSVPLDAAQLRELHAAGRLLWIFDGMDEVRTPERRQHYGELIHTLVRDAPSRAIVTSRAVGCEALVDSLGTCPSYSLRDFDDKQIDVFLRNWYALEFVEEPEVSERRRQRLAQAIEQSRTVRDLCRNPLLLTLLALLNRGDELPRRRHKVFERALDLMVGQWDANKHLPTDQGPGAIFEREDKLQFLRELAWAMHNNRWPESQNNLLERENLLRFTTEFVKKQFNTDDDRAQTRARALIRDLEERNQTLTYLGHDQYGFVHKTFLEYLAAEALIRFLSPEERVQRFLDDAENQNSWEVLTLACGLLDDQDQTLQILRILQGVLECLIYTPQKHDERFRVYAFAIRCLSEIRKAHQEPIRSLVSGVMRLFQQDVLANFRAGFDWLPYPVVYEALRFFGPRWPEHDAWLHWAQRPEWRNVAKNLAHLDLVDIQQCVIATASIEQRVPLLLALLKQEVDSLFSTRLMQEASLLGPWRLEEFLALARELDSAGEVTHFRIGSQLARIASSELVQKLLQAVLNDRIKLHIARNSLSSADQQVVDLAKKALFKLTWSQIDWVREQAISWLFSGGWNSTEEQSRFRQLAEQDQSERVRYTATRTLIKNIEQDWAIQQIMRFQNSQNPAILSWLATDLDALGREREVARNSWIRLLQMDGNRYQCVALAALAKGHLDDTTRELIIKSVDKTPRLIQTFEFRSLLFDVTDLALENFILNKLTELPEYYELHSSLSPYQNSSKISRFNTHLRELLNSQLEENQRLNIAQWLYQSKEDLQARDELLRLAKSATKFTIQIDAATQLGDIYRLSILARSAEKAEDRQKALISLVHTATHELALNSLLLEIAHEDPAASVRWSAAQTLQSRLNTTKEREDVEQLVFSLARQTVDEKVQMDAAQQLALYPVLLQLAESAQEEQIRQRAADTLTWLDIRADILRLGTSHRRRGRVDLAGQAVGIIEETEQGSRFIYDTEWLRRRDAEAISLTLPLRPEPYDSVGLHPFFENLLPEGAYLDLVAKKTNVVRSDKFGLLLATCGDCAGAVEVHPLPRS